MSVHQPITPAPADDILAIAHGILADPTNDREWQKAAQEAVDTNGDETTDLHWLLAEEQAAERYSDWAYRYEYNTGREAPEFDLDRWLPTASQATVPAMGGSF